MYIELGVSVSKKTSKRRKAGSKSKKSTKATRAKKINSRRSALEVDGLSLKDIKTLEQKLQKAKAQAHDRERKALKVKIDKIISGTGFTIFEIYGVATKRRGKSISVAKYANPDDVSDTWTGRGRKPNWVLARLKKGGKLDDYAI